jgi:hypothetical protein
MSRNYATRVCTIPGAQMRGTWGNHGLCGEVAARFPKLPPICRKFPRTRYTGFRQRKKQGGALSRCPLFGFLALEILPLAPLPRPENRKRRTETVRPANSLRFSSLQPIPRPQCYRSIPGILSIPERRKSLSGSMLRPLERGPAVAIGYPQPAAFPGQPRGV